MPCASRCLTAAVPAGYNKAEVAMRVKLIACEVLTREISRAAASSPHVFDITYMPFGLHATPDMLRERLQAEIDACEGSRCEYIVLGYGLCSRGTAELAARSIPIVVPRAHDCITLFLGSRERYNTEFLDNPGTYYYTAGWIERSEGEVDQGYISDKKGNDAQDRYREYVEKYGEDNAKFLLEQEQQWLSHYSRAALLDTGVGDIEVYREFTRRIAAAHSWEYIEKPGDDALIRRIANADFAGDDFLTVNPGQKIIETFDDRVIAAEP
jgi:hypothetical protein